MARIAVLAVWIALICFLDLLLVSLLGLFCVSASERERFIAKEILLSSHRQQFDLADFTMRKRAAAIVTAIESFY